MYGILFQILLFVQRLLMPLVNALKNYVSQNFLHFSLISSSSCTEQIYSILLFAGSLFLMPINAVVTISSISSVKLTFDVVCFYAFVFYVFLFSYVMYMFLT